MSVPSAWWPLTGRDSDEEVTRRVAEGIEATLPRMKPGDSLTVERLDRSDLGGALFNVSFTTGNR